MVYILYIVSSKLHILTIFWFTWISPSDPSRFTKIVVPLRNLLNSKWLEIFKAYDEHTVLVTKVPDRLYQYYSTSSNRFA